MNREEIERRLIELKQEKKQLKKQLEELPSFEVGCWIKDEHSKALYFIEEIDFTKINGVKSFGFSTKGGWSDSRHRSTRSLTEDFIQATDKEVETALIAEAKKRGFKEGVTVHSFIHNINLKCKNVNIKSKYISRFNKLHFGGDVSKCVVIFKDGKWAEIIQPKTVHIPSGDYTETQVKDILNNKFNK